MALEITNGLTPELFLSDSETRFRELCAIAMLTGFRAHCSQILHIGI